MTSAHIEPDLYHKNICVSHAFTLLYKLYLIVISLLTIKYFINPFINELFTVKMQIMLIISVSVR